MARSPSPPQSFQRRNAGTFGRDRDGAAAVEFALIAPILFAILGGMIETGLFLWNKHSIGYAVEETSRAVMTRSAISADAVTADLKGRLLGMDPGAVTATVATETLGATTYVAITASYSYTFVLGSAFGWGPVGIVSKAYVPLTPTE